VTEQDSRSGVVSLLDERHSTFVQEIWDELERELGLTVVRRTPWPHFSYQVGDYETGRIASVLERVVRDTPPLTVTTGGLAAFTGPWPIHYVPVVRTAELSLRQQRLWDAIGDACRQAVDYYKPSNWVPHVTLAEKDLDDETLSLAMRLLSVRRLQWTIDIDNLGFIDGTGVKQELMARFKLRG
jgi:hypothetical protein